MYPQYGYPFMPPPNTGASLSEQIRTLKEFQRMMRKDEVKAKKKEEEKKKSEKKPDKKGLTTLEVAILFTLASPIIGPIYLTLLQWGVEHMRTALH